MYNHEDAGGVREVRGEGEQGTEAGAEAQGEGKEVAEEEARAMPGKAAPKGPSAEVREAHWRNGHRPPRSWCSICVAASMVASPHQADGTSAEDEVPIVACDYCYPGARKEDLERLKRKAKERKERGEPEVDDETPEGSKPTLVLKDVCHGGPHAHCVARKGVCSSAISKVCLLYTSPSPRDGLLSRMPSSA